MSRFVTREGVEHLRHFHHGKREDQPIWLGCRQRGFGCGRGGRPIPQGQVGNSREQMRFDECERRKIAGRLPDISEHSQRRRRVSLCDANHRTGDINDVRRVAIGGESTERGARLIQQPQAGLRGRQPSGAQGGEHMHTCELRLSLRGRRKFFQGRLQLPTTGMQHARNHVHVHGRGRINPGLGDLPGAAQPALRLVELAYPDPVGSQGA